MLTIKKLLPIMSLLILAIMVSGCTGCSLSKGINISKEINISKQINFSTPTQEPTLVPTTIPASTPVSSSTVLDTPTLVSPAEGASLSDWPRTVTFVWQPVAGADGYFTEVQINDGSRSPIFNQTTDTTSFTSNWNGMNAGRWRVTATDSTGAHASSAPSEWRTFDYTV